MKGFDHDNWITREGLTEARIDEIRREIGPLLGDLILDQESREAARRETLADWPRGRDLHVFGYGSLMWNPAIYHKGMRCGRIYGYHRRFCLWMPAGRGSPDNPGLMLALDHGGSCRGMAIRIAADEIESETQILWRREMISASYRPTWVDVHMGDEVVRAITFVVNVRHPRYVSGLAFERTVERLALARGRLGNCRDYLANTVLHLDELGIDDGPMHRLRDEVERCFPP